MGMAQNVQKTRVQGGVLYEAPVFLAAPSGAVGVSGVEDRALLPVFGQGLSGKIVLPAGSFGVAASRFDQLGHVAVHLRELLGEGPIPAGLCD